MVSGDLQTPGSIINIYDSTVTSFTFTLFIYYLSKTIKFFVEKTSDHIYPFRY
jgi:hypothetical protein